MGGTIDIGEVRDDVIIYGLVDPRTDELRYVGQSVNGLRRAKSHSSPSAVNLPDHCHRWIHGLIREGHRPQEFAVETWDGSGDPGEWLDEAERHWIAYFRYIGCRLTNLTDGGHGGLRGYRFDPEVTQARGKKTSEKLKGRPLTEEHRNMISKNHAGSDHPTSFKDGHEPWNKGKKDVLSTEGRQKMRLAKLGKPRSEETRKKISESMKIARSLSKKV